MRVYAQQGDTVDLLCWRHLGATAGMTEQVFALNPGLSLHGPILPMGTVVTLPAPPSPQSIATERPLIQLWD
ncbi:tail protein X [Stenotrophomonas rhizophila]|uniref:tail protein X n=1 Tax=Stenotrophomonas rhizophila TaxID=216778 RepID=UPI001E5BB9FA|nr:tail protein X [Stenotrophomonas rhizophila]MCC7632586.1 tail protein X [Stenotrophomonas rhizophila]MCC7663438.1 tail protein X [Stenotrophomonas rhizophila]